MAKVDISQNPEGSFGKWKNGSPNHHMTMNLFMWQNSDDNSWTAHINDKKEVWQVSQEFAWHNICYDKNQYWEMANKSSVTMAVLASQKKLNIIVNNR